MSASKPHPRQRSLITRRRLLRLLAAGAGAGLATGLYAWRIEPHWLKIEERSLTIRGLPPELRGRSLVHISDLHIGPRVDDDYLLDTFRRVDALAPDFVVYTGDFISHHETDFEQVHRVMSHLPTGRLGSFGSLGNHDYGPQWEHAEYAERVVQYAADAGVRILRNEIAEAHGLHVVGLDDLWAGRFDLKVLRSLPQGAAALALSHNPDTADLPGWDGCPIYIMAGHTHGGQCKPPFLPPPLLPVKNRRYTSGEFALSGDRTMHISTGVGHLIRVRFNVRPEVTVFHLQPA